MSIQKYKTQHQRFWTGSHVVSIKSRRPITCTIYCEAEAAEEDKRNMCRRNNKSEKGNTKSKAQGYRNNTASSTLWCVVHIVIPVLCRVYERMVEWREERRLPSVIPLHAKYSETTDAVSSIVAMNEPSTFIDELCIPASVNVQRISISYGSDGTYSTYNLAQQEVVQLAEDEEDGCNDVVPYWADFLQDAEDDVQHDSEIDKSSTIYRGRS